MYIIVVKHKQPTENTIMKEQNKKNRIDDLEKEINLLKERVTKLEASFEVKDKEDNKAKALFM